METIQQQIGALQTSVKRQRLLNIALLGIIVAGGFIAAVRPAGDATFDTITCKGWKVVDADGKVRIAAVTLADGEASVVWKDKDADVKIKASTFAEGNAKLQLLDKYEKVRITAFTNPDGQASVHCFDKDGMLRIYAGTSADGQSSVLWRDKEGRVRIGAVTRADGTVLLPTEDRNPPKEP